MPTGGLDAGIDQHPLHAGGSARHESGPPLRQQAGVLGMKAVDIAVGRHGIEHRDRVDMLRQRQLHENAIGRAMLVAGDRSHQGDEFAGRCRGRNSDHIGIDPHAIGRRRLALHVGATRREVADEDNHQPRAAVEHRHERVDFASQRAFNPGRERPAVEHCGCHDGCSLMYIIRS